MDNEIVELHPPLVTFASIEYDGEPLPPVQTAPPPPAPYDHKNNNLVVVNRNDLESILVSKAERRAIFTYLLKEGVIVVRKDAYLPEHQHLPGVPNLKVMMIVKSLVSMGYLNQVFNWQWNYYTVTNKGVTFLAKALGKCFFFFSAPL